MEKLQYDIKKRTSKIELPTELGFGKLFTDHIFEMEYNPEKGWHNPIIKHVENLSVHPGSMFIHYGQAIFEGLKAFKSVDGRITIFRPKDHIQRLNNSAKRICIPLVDEEFLLYALTELVSIESDWIPTNPGESLYIRPVIYGMDPSLGVKPSTNYKLFILLSPVGAYYPEGFKPVKILVQDNYVRAVRKGLGECKTPANYAASLLAAKEAKEKGFTQVLWLDGIDQKFLEEVGTMNIFVEFKDEIATPKLNGSILPGVTRRSVIQLLKDNGKNVTERGISIDEVIAAYKNGTLISLFGTGTAAVISPVGWLTYKDLKMTLNNGEPSNIAQYLFDQLSSLHILKVEDKYDWVVQVNNEEVEA
ncbi:MAG: branched chain amino acid aminotransferase [Ignavibacteriales bacterium CG_4_9_14_3_um_filter_30_11]|nr:MAG: branched chain amino acid aminotransferase [Ignavibacteriales bacterium CG_4_9_14_3_um_filter_30_11]